MAFWTDNNFEPKQEFQFKIIFNVFNYNYDIGWQYVSSCDKPSYQINEKSYKLINTQLKYPTNMIWSDINMELIDTTDNRVLAFLNVLNDLQAKDKKSFNGINLRNNCETYDSPDKNNIAKINVEIQTLDKEGVPVEIWKLQGAWIKSIKQSQLNYGSENVSKINLTLCYDWAEIVLNSPVIPDAAAAAAKVGRELVDQTFADLGLRDLASTNILNISETDLSNLRAPSIDLDGRTGRPRDLRDKRRLIEDNATEYEFDSRDRGDFTGGGSSNLA